MPPARSLVRWSLTLYVNGASASSLAALEAVRRICDEELVGQVDLLVVDVADKPALVPDDGILAVPTLVKHLPEPLRRLVGDLSDVDWVRAGLDLGAPTTSTETDAPADPPSTPSRGPVVVTPLPGPSQASSGGLGGQIEELIRAVAAIRAGAVDAVIGGGPHGEQLYTLVSADRPYRMIVEQMGDGALTVSARGIVLYANQRLAALLDAGREGLLGRDLHDVLDINDPGALADLLAVSAGETRRRELEVRRGDGGRVPVLAAATGMRIEDVVVRCLILADLSEQRGREHDLAAAHADLADSARELADSARELADSARELEEAQRVGGIGSWYWERAGDTLRWSAQMYRIFGIDPARAEPTFPAALVEDLLDRDPEDPTAPRSVWDKALRDHRPFLVEQRLVQPGGEIRHTITRGEVIEGQDGAVIGMRGTTQDVSDLQRAAQAEHEARERLLRQTLELVEEQKIKEKLQQAVLPLRLPEVPGMRLAMRYLAANRPALVGGDWYDAFRLPDGSLAVAVGDVVGHDLDDAAAMSQLRNALRAYAFAGDPPSTVMTRLNRFTTDLGEGALATAIYARLDLEDLTLRWAQAGHLPPLLISSAGPRLLPSPVGMILGVDRETPYAEAVVRLRAADILVLYTDGLIERRERSIDTGLAALVHAAASLRTSSPEQICDALAERLLLDGAHEDDVCLLVLTPSP